LYQRYGDRMDQVFIHTVTHGWVTKGMPNWSGILTQAQLRDVLAFLHSVQAP
jgi:polar amino acid transport system substrate-binding protein